MASHFKHTILSMLAMVISISLTACQAAANPSVAYTPRKGDIVQPCGQQFFPVVTNVGSHQTSTQSVYFTSGVHLYALDANNGKMR